jgi:hypothetical protein
VLLFTKLGNCVCNGGVKSADRERIRQYQITVFGIQLQAWLYTASTVRSYCHVHEVNYICGMCGWRWGRCYILKCKRGARSLTDYRREDYTLCAFLIVIRWKPWRRILWKLLLLLKDVHKFISSPGKFVCE